MENTAADVLQAMSGVHRQTAATATEMAQKQITQKSISDKIDGIQDLIKSAFSDLTAQIANQITQLAGQGPAGHLRATDATQLPKVDTARRQFEPKPIIETEERKPEFGTVGVGWGGEGMIVTLLRMRQRAQSQLPNAEDRWIAANAGGKYEEALRPPDDIDKELLQQGLERISSAGSLRCRRCGEKFFTMEFGERPLIRARKHAQEHEDIDGMHLKAPEHMVSRFVADRNF